MGSGHALLSPSASSRWLVCTRAPVEEAKEPDSTSRAADEGTLAHLYAETLLHQWQTPEPEHDFVAKVKAIEAHELYTHDMRSYVDDYVSIILSYMNADAFLFIETKVDITDYAPDCKGTADAIIIRYEYNLDTKVGMYVLYFFDLKYGKGVEVSAVANPQLRLYSLGALKDFGFLGDIELVKMQIVQPRLGNYSKDEIYVSDLLHWGENYVKPRAALAFKGKGEFVSGSHCKFCKIKHNCAKLAEDNLKLASVDFSDPSRLTEAQIIEIYNRMPTFKLWEKAVQDHVYAKALGGYKWPGLKLVEGRKTRKYTDEQKIGAALEDEMYFDVWQPKQLYGITALEGLIGKKEFSRVVGPFIRQQPGKPSLTSADSDKEEYNSVLSDFQSDWIDPQDTDD